jgi:AmiR/NasT family two-component response regulator
MKRNSLPEEASRSEASLRILLVDRSLTRASVLEEGLREAGYTQVTVIRDMQSRMRHIVDPEPDVSVIDLKHPNRDALEQMFQVSRCVARPVAMFVDRSDAAMINAAIEAGVSAYVVDSLKNSHAQARNQRAGGVCADAQGVHEREPPYRRERAKHHHGLAAAEVRRT